MKFRDIISVIICVVGLLGSVALLTEGDSVGYMSMIVYGWFLYYVLDKN